MDSVQFLFDGDRLKPEQTPEEVSSTTLSVSLDFSLLQLEMEDGDSIDVFDVMVKPVNNDKVHNDIVLKPRLPLRTKCIT